MTEEQEFRKQTEEAKFEAFSLMCKKVADLEKENAELKEKLEVVIALKDEEIGCVETDFNTFKSKAKEIIKTCLGFMQAFGYSPSIDKFVTDAEQFLNSEVEK